ncbi:MAG: fimbrillin family protein [Mucinivorans sp.]
MKRVFRISSLLSLALTLIVSCQKEATQKAETGTTMPLLIETSIQQGAGQEKAPVSKAPNASSSKSAWVNGDQFGLFVSLASGELKLNGNTHGKFTYDNLPYTYAAVTAKFTTSAGIPSGTIFFPYRNTNVDLWGVFPYDSQINSVAVKQDAAAYPWDIKIDQSTAANVTASDFLVARTSDVTPNNTRATSNLVFNHKLTRLLIQLAIPVDIDGKRLNTTTPITTIDIHNTNVQSTYNFNTDVLSAKANSSQIIKPLYLGQETIASDNFMVYEAIVVPQTIASNAMFLRVIVLYDDASQGLFLLNLSTELNLTQGTQQNLQVTFDEQKRLRLAGSKLLDWSYDSYIHTGDIVEDDKQ